MIYVHDIKPQWAQGSELLTHPVLGYVDAAFNQRPKVYPADIWDEEYTGTPEAPQLIGRLPAAASRAAYFLPPHPFPAWVFVAELRIQAAWEVGSYSGSFDQTVRLATMNRSWEQVTAMPDTMLSRLPPPSRLNVIDDQDEAIRNIYHVDGDPSGDGPVAYLEIGFGGLDFVFAEGGASHPPYWIIRDDSYGHLVTMSADERTEDGGVNEWRSVDIRQQEADMSIGSFLGVPIGIKSTGPGHQFSLSMDIVSYVDQ